jgi:hypothetical protein
MLLPASLKSTTQVPAPLKVTLPEAKEQPVDVVLREITTLSPDVAVALGVYEPLALPAAGAVLALMVLDVDPAAKAADEGRNVKPTTSNIDVAPRANILANIVRTVQMRVAPPER